MRPIDADALVERTKELVSRCMKMQWAGADLYVKYLRIVKGMIDSAPTIEQPPNDPLTLEELREMDGEPVWVADLLIPKCSCYHFVQKIGCHTLLMEPRYYPAEDVMVPHYCANDENQGYQNTWLAYRRKPEESTA